MAKNPVYVLRTFLAPSGLTDTRKKIPALDLLLTSQERTEGAKEVCDLVGNKKKTICLFTFATGEKCYSKPWWEDFYDQLEKAFPNYNFVEVLPAENVSQLSFCLPTYPGYSRTGVFYCKL